jgi:hypothetical protein
MIQSGGGDWIINSLPSGIESQTPYGALRQDRISVLKRQKTFYLLRLNRNKSKKYFSVPSVTLW